MNRGEKDSPPTRGSARKWRGVAKIAGRGEKDFAISWGGRKRGGTFKTGEIGQMKMRPGKKRTKTADKNVRRRGNQIST